MSTRATYQFYQRHKPNVAVYIHHDGYPEGAAGFYLLPAIQKADGYLTVEAFIRANDSAEITGGHDAHGDTEYRYTIDLETGCIEVWQRRWVGEVAEWRLYSAGPLVDFINKHAQECAPGTEVREHGNGRWMTAEMASAEANRKAAEARSYRERFPQHTGNADSMDAAAHRAAEFAAGFKTAQAVLTNEQMAEAEQAGVRG